MDKNAQAAVVGVILIIGVLIAVYTALLPKAEKCRIFPDLSSCNETAKNESAAIFLENPGFLEPIEEAVEYNLGNIQLFNKRNIDFPINLQDAVVEKSWSRSKEISSDFIIPGEVEKVVIFISIAEGNGRLAIYLNDKKVGSISGVGVDIIDVPSNLLKPSNTLKVVASSPFLPGAVNRVRISSLILKETYTLTQPKISRAFVINQDAGDIISARLEFDADCYSSDKLKISINSKTAVNVNICTSFSSEVKGFVQTSNQIDFESEGNFFLHDIKLKMKFKQRDYKTYFFAISNESYSKIKEGTKLAMLYLRFPDTENKQVTLYVNGNTVNIDTNKIEYKTAINRLLLKGQNSIKIVPETAVTIQEISLKLE